MTPAVTAAPPEVSSPVRVLARLRTLPRRALLLVALVPVLVFAWLPLLGSGEPLRATLPTAATPDAAMAAPPAAPAAPAGETAPVSLPPGSPAAIAALGQRVRAARAPYEPRWRPAAKVTGDAPVPAAVVTEHAPAELVPTAILLSRDGPAIAIVQGQVRRVGDAVSDHTIVAISEGCVDYVQGQRRLTVPLAEPRSGGSR